ncbi:MAG: hypothetical protein ACE5HP_05860 [Gemmatimonadota bacterium]
MTPPGVIEEWVDELLDLRLEYADETEIVAEVDYYLRQAAEWLGAREAGQQCA